MIFFLKKSHSQSLEAREKPGNSIDRYRKLPCFHLSHLKWNSSFFWFLFFWVFCFLFNCWREGRDTWRGAPLRVELQRHGKINSWQRQSRAKTPFPPGEASRVLFSRVRMPSRADEQTAAAALTSVERWRGSPSIPHLRLRLLMFPARSACTVGLAGSSLEVQRWKCHV